jgi:hypothetical protein
MSERLSDEELGEVERRIACACAELWRESRDKSNAGLKHYLSVALHGGTEETKEHGRVACREFLDEWLRAGDTAAIARFGRFAEEVAHKGPGRSSPQPSAEEKLYWDMNLAIRLDNEILTKAELMTWDYLCHQERTIQRCFQRIAERGNLRRVTKDGEEIWTPAPRS